MQNPVFLLVRAVWMGAGLPEGQQGGTVCQCNGVAYTDEDLSEQVIQLQPDPHPHVFILSPLLGFKLDKGGNTPLP